MMIANLEDVYRIDVMSKASPALRAVKFEPPKAPPSVPRAGQKNAPGGFKKSQKKNSKAKPGQSPSGNAPAS
jgi:hypothetical protein